MIDYLSGYLKTFVHIVKEPGKALILFLLFMGLNAGLLFSQDTLGDTDIEVYTLTGSIGLQGHAYTTSQDIDRREPLGALTTVNLDYSFLGFRSGIDIRYSTDENKLRQSMNRFSFNGSWRWITLNAGDVNPSYADYSLRGTMLRGGEVVLTPGNFFLELAAGRVNRMTSSSNGQFPRNFSYNRWLYAASIGIGNQGDTNFRLTTMYGKDDTESLPDTTGANLPATGALSPPAENLAITPDFEVYLFDETFKIGAQVTASAFTRDTNSPAMSAEEAGVPSFVTNFFTPRNSTRFTYAGEADAGLMFDPFQLELKFERIQPGFKSMGLRQLRDDQQTITISPRFQLFGNRISIDVAYAMSEDNLLGQRLSTQENDNLSVNTNFRITDMIRLGAGYNRYSAESVSESNGDDEFTTGGQSQLSQTFRLLPSISIISGSVSHNISLSGVYQLMESRFQGANGDDVSESETMTGSLNYSLTFPTGLSINSALNGVMGEARNSSFTTYGVNAGVGYAFFDGNLNVDVSADVSFNQNERQMGEQVDVHENLQLNGNFSASYTITTGSSLRLSLRTQNNSILEGAGQEFSEMEGRVRFQHRF